MHLGSDDNIIRRLTKFPMPVSLVLIRIMNHIYPLHEYAAYLSAFSAHSIKYKGVRYATVEHAYHCQRYPDTTDSDIRRYIAKETSARKAWKLSQTFKSYQHKDWDTIKVNVMEELCRAKMDQHEDVKQALLSSGDYLILKDYPDEFWGVGINGGKNTMGCIWMKLRDEIKENATLTEQK
jgi:ribA/ribD-fused uncharacterized protein